LVQLPARRHATKGSDAATANLTPKAAVESGLERFRARDLPGAIALFQQALASSPTRDEAQAAHYNLACALTRQKEWATAVASVRAAVNEFGLPLAVPLEVRP
jgi:hypothetical protein